MQQAVSEVHPGFRWQEPTIALAIARQVFQRRCVLLVDRCQWTGNECDVLGVAKCLRIIDVEIKISRGDLKADAGKDKWWHYAGWGRIVDGKHVPAPRTARMWPHSVWKHYYALPADIWKPELLDCLPSAASGVILLRAPDRPGAIVTAHVVRRAKPNSNAKPIDGAALLDIARLANLRMWDAYEQLARRSV